MNIIRFNGYDIILENIKRVYSDSKYTKIYIDSLGTSKYGEKTKDIYNELIKAIKSNKGIDLDELAK